LDPFYRKKKKHPFGWDNQLVKQPKFSSTSTIPYLFPGTKEPLTEEPNHQMHYPTKAVLGKRNPYRFGSSNNRIYEHPTSPLPSPSFIIPLWSPSTPLAFGP
jgi:hypothetical protein